MANQAYLIRTKFEADNGGTRWGWRIGDDYVQSYTDCYTEQEVPTKPFDLLANAAREAAEDERNLLENLLHFERGIAINGSWHQFEAIAPVLQKVLYGRKESATDDEPEAADTGQPASEPVSKPPIANLCCPKCGHGESFVIEVTESLLMFADGTVLDSDAGEEWGDWSECRCHACAHRSTVHEFRKCKQTTKEESAHGKRV